jgi:site-specific DNA recombinase
MNPTKKKACGLIRVSSDEQAKGGYGLEFQETDIRAFCERNGLELKNVFRDEGYSGSTAARPGFQEMMAWARDRRFDVLVVWKLDRLFRNTKLTLQTVDELSGFDIEFRSVQESFTHDSNGRFLLTIFAAGAEKERKDIAMRMHAGMIASAKRGTWVAGASNPPFGYRYNPATKRLEVDDDEARVVRQIFRWLVGEKLSLYKIQARLNEMKVPTRFDRTGRKKPSGSTRWWATRTIGRIAGNEVYTGTFTFRKYVSVKRAKCAANLRPEEDWLVSHCPPIISADTFHKAQQQLKKNSENSPRRTQRLYLLSKLLICGHDNRRMEASSRPSEGDRPGRKLYFCSGIRKQRSPVRCPSARVSESRIAPPIWDAMKELLANPATVLDGLTNYRDRQLQSAELSRQVKTLEARVQKLTARLRRLAEIYLDEAVDKQFFQTEEKRLKGEIGAAERELAKLKGSQITQDEQLGMVRSITDLYAAYKSRLENASDEVKREIFRMFIKGVVVRGEDLDIEVLLPPIETAGSVKSDFVGQPPRPLSRKDTLTLFIQTKLIPISQILRDRKIHKNLLFTSPRTPRSSTPG